MIFFKIPYLSNGFPQNPILSTRRPEESSYREVKKMKNFITAVIVAGSITACQQHTTDSTQTNEFVRSGSRPAPSHIWSVDERQAINRAYQKLDNRQKNWSEAIKNMDMKNVPGCKQNNCTLVLVLGEHGHQSLVITSKDSDSVFVEMNSLKEFYLSHTDRVIPIQ